MTDGELRDRVLSALLGDALLRDVAVQARVGALVRVLRAPGAGSRGGLEVRVLGGTVTLQGEVAALAGERLAAAGVPVRQS
jgi:hypothetical protein